MSIIGPGSVVELIDDRPCPDGSPCPLVLGARYVVLHVWDYLPYSGTDDSWAECSVDLEGQPRPAPDLAWGLYRFKVIGGDPVISARELEAV